MLCADEIVGIVSNPWAAKKRVHFPFHVCIGAFVPHDGYIGV